MCTPVSTFAFKTRLKTPGCPDLEQIDAFNFVIGTRQRPVSLLWARKSSFTHNHRNSLSLFYLPLWLHNWSAASRVWGTRTRGGNVTHRPRRRMLLCDAVETKGHEPQLFSWLTHSWRTNVWRVSVYDILYDLPVGVRSRLHSHSTSRLTVQPHVAAMLKQEMQLATLI